jgi:hypothetical protein
MTTEDFCEQVPFLLQFGEPLNRCESSWVSQRAPRRSQEGSRSQPCGVTRNTAVSRETTDDD